LKTAVKNALCEINSEGLLDHSLAPLPSIHGHGGRVGFRVQGLGVGGSGAGFGVWNSEFTVQGVEFRVQGLGCRL
jgi:hypothetical protein